MDKSVDVVLGDGFGDTLSAPDVDVVKVEVPANPPCQLPAPNSTYHIALYDILGRILSSDEIEHAI